MHKQTIWENLCAKLGRTPTNAECREECQRIIREARNDLVAKRAA